MFKMFDNLLQDKEAILEISKYFGISIEVSEKIYHTVGPDIDKIKVYMKQSKYNPKIVKSTICLRCGRRLTNLDAISLGYGQVCYDKYLKELKNDTRFKEINIYGSKRGAKKES